MNFDLMTITTKPIVTIVLLSLLSGTAIADTEVKALSMINTYSPQSLAIAKKVRQVFMTTPGMPKGLSATVTLMLSQDSTVVPDSVVVIRSSGNAAFDASLKSATYRAGTFRLPNSSRLRDGAKHAPDRVAFQYDG